MAPVVAWADNLAVLPDTPKVTSQNTVVTAKAVVPSILELKISEAGQLELNFGVMRPSALDETVLGPIVIKVDVTSNIGDRYVVTHAMNGTLRNEEGVELSADHLKFTSQPEKSKGLGVPDPQSVGSGAQTVFSSDQEGTSDTINIEYRLTVPPAQAPGNYSTLLTYTVSAV